MTPQFEFPSHEEAILAQAYEKALSGKGQEQIDMGHFVDDYGPENVESDRHRVAELEAKFEAEMTPETQEALRLGTILEAIITEQVELNEWLGPDVRTRKASRYDDVVNGVDTIAEIEQENSTSHLALAIDVTHGVMLQKKFDRIKREIDEGTLTTIKYFENSDETFRGRLLKVPRVVLGVEKSAVVELAGLWNAGKNKELATHPVQVQLIEEITVQLQSCLEYAQKTGKGDIARVYERQLRIIEGIANQPDKKKLRAQVEADTSREPDRTQQAIQLGAKRLPAIAGLHAS
jgi:hypothetical protein